NGAASRMPSSACASAAAWAARDYSRFTTDCTPMMPRIMKRRAVELAVRIACREHRLPQIAYRQSQAGHLLALQALDKARPKPDEIDVWKERARRAATDRRRKTLWARLSDRPALRCLLSP